MKKPSLPRKLKLLDHLPYKGTLHVVTQAEAGFVVEWDAESKAHPGRCVYDIATYPKEKIKEWTGVEL